MNLMDGDPNVRGTAVEGLISRQGSASLENVLATLKDNDDSVRFRTLYKANYAGIQIPDDTLLSLVREDGSPDVRGMALKILADRPNIGKQHLTDIARNSLGDTDPTVRDVAEEVLSQLSTPVDSIEYGE
jgi:HEAT repeat protein